METDIEETTDEETTTEESSAAAKIKELRNTNIEVMKERDRLKTEFETMKAQLQALQSAADSSTKKATTDAEEKKSLAQRLEALEAAKAAADQALAAERAKTRTSHIRDTLASAFAERNGGDAKAAADAAALALPEWEMADDGSLRHRTQPYSADSGKQVTPGEYATAFLVERPHFAGRSSGDNRRAGRLVNGKPAVNATDPEALGRYAEAIAKGDMEIYTPE